MDGFWRQVMWYEGTTRRRNNENYFYLDGEHGARSVDVSLFSYCRDINIYY